MGNDRDRMTDPDLNDTNWNRKNMATDDDVVTRETVTRYDRDTTDLDDTAAENEEGGGEAIGAGAGALGGAGVGMAVGGPPGAVVGGAVGAAGGAGVGDQAEEETEEDTPGTTESYTAR
ncbi:MAG TPA: glycine zipper domain-containing protein [Candidatus Limnocylindrales bacterium]|nr:glycine zipper domain-containing protein [Candidatus Limnocylindrales bacterium]